MSKDYLFKPGQSGNPAGRPKGSCNKQRMFKELVEPRSKEIIERGIHLAMHGEEKVQARLMIFFLDRVLPAARKDRLMPADIHLSDGSLVEQSNHIKNLISNKSITPEQGNALLNAVKMMSEIKYKEDLEKELEELKSEFKAFREKFGK